MQQEIPYVVASKGIAHKLNTVYVHALRNNELFKKFEKIFNECYNYLYNSNVRYKIFKFMESQENIDTDIIPTTEIRWIAIRAAVINFEKIYQIIVNTLDTINSDKSKELKKKITDSTFIYLMYWCLALIEIIEKPYRCFQSDSILGMEINEFVISLKIEV